MTRSFETGGSAIGLSATDARAVVDGLFILTQRPAASSFILRCENASERGEFVSTGIQGIVRNVSDHLSKSGGFACPRCKAKMDEVVRIAPLVDEPGLIAYVPGVPLCHKRYLAITGRWAGR
jgi:hypothetical protein